ncbi:MAG: purine-nucleoside phosphorylase [Pseudomonadota bacterium]
MNSSRGTDSKDAELNSAAEELQPKIAVILGSGLGSFVDDLEIHKTFSFDELDGFPQPTVTGHLGRMMIGRLRSAPIIVLQGRVHLYEGHSASTINTVIRRIAELGCSVLIVTNAAGGIRTDFTPGHIALIDDHINAMGTSPLIGPNNDAIGPRFPDMSDTYSARLREISRVAAANIGIPLDSGVYLATVGPAFETPAEVRAFRALGADMVGMSTVPEVISARHVGMEVLGFSIITNLAAGLGSGQLSHEETLQHADRAAGNVRLLLGSVIPAIKLA